MTTPAHYPRTVPALYGRAFERGGDRSAVRVAESMLTYADLDRESAAVANGLQEAGVDPGDRVAVCFANRLRTPVFDAGIARAGAVRVPLNPMYTPRDIAHVLEDAGASGLITDPDLANTIREETTVLSTLEHRFVFDEDVPQFERVESLLSQDPVPPDLELEPEERAAIYYTGGTTGEPKGVVYSHRVLVANLLAHLAEFDIGEGDVGLLTPPLSHSAGTFLWTGLLARGEVVVQDGFDVEAFAAAIRSQNATWTMLVPTMLYRLLDADSDVQNAVASLGRIYYGTAPVRQGKLQEAVERLGPSLVQFYGQTEVPNLITTFPARAHERAVERGDPERLQSAGTPTLQSAIRIVHPETGEPVPTGDPGEILASAPYAFEGYHGRPDDTAETLREGWVATGDIGRLDEEGFLYLLDRKANMVTSGGLNVYTREVEATLSEHPDVSDVAVIGIPDDEWGEAVHAIVIAESEAALTEAELLVFADDRLASFKKPKSIEIREGLPRTTLGKIDRESLRGEFWADQDRSVH